MIVDGDGGPLGVVVAPANVHDTKLLTATIDAIVVQRPQPTLRCPQRLCLDRGYDNPTGHNTCLEHGYQRRIQAIGHRKQSRTPRRVKPRRWVVERTLAWLSKCRAILVRHAKKSSNYLGLTQLACALLWYRRLHKLGHAHQFPVFG